MLIKIYGELICIKHGIPEFSLTVRQECPCWLHPSPCHCRSRCRSARFRSGIPTLADTMRQPNIKHQTANSKITYRIQNTKYHNKSILFRLSPPRSTSSRRTVIVPMPSKKDLQTLSPTLTRLLKSRLAPIRETALLAAAASAEKPVKPAAGDCCGSSCNPCVMDLYGEELKVWKECSRGRESEGEGVVDVEDRTRKMPGAYEW